MQKYIKMPLTIDALTNAMDRTTWNATRGYIWGRDRTLFVDMVKKVPAEQRGFLYIQYDRRGLGAYPAVCKFDSRRMRFQL